MAPSFAHGKHSLVCLTQLNKHWIIGKTSPQILWLQFTIHKVWRFSTCSLQNKQSWLICKAFHYCRKPSLSRLGSSFPFIVAYNECFNDPIMLAVFRKARWSPLCTPCGPGPRCWLWLEWGVDIDWTQLNPGDKELSSSCREKSPHVGGCRPWSGGVPRSGELCKSLNNCHLTPTWLDLQSGCS